MPEFHYEGLNGIVVVVEHERLHSRQFCDMTENDATAETNVNVVSTHKAKQLCVLMQHDLCFSQQGVFFSAEIQKRSHTVIFHQPFGHRDVTNSIKEMMAASSEFLCDAVQQMNMPRMTYIN